MRIMVLGGYGTFGRRVVESLIQFPSLNLLVAGRNRHKSAQFCAELDPKGQRTVALSVDRKDISQALERYHPDILIDASGPFQSYGKAPYIVPKACIASGVHYLDLADSAPYVDGIKILNDQAKSMGVCVISGLSTCPALTSAVLTEMSQQIEIERVTAGLAPSPQMHFGLSVIQAMLHMAGDNVQTAQNGTKTEKPYAVALGQSVNHSIAPAGEIPLYQRTFMLIDVPELLVLKDRFPSLTQVWFGAGVGTRLWTHILRLLAFLRNRLKTPRLTPLAPIARWVLSNFQHGEHRGGMFVNVEGTQQGNPASACWDLIAEGDDGPKIPVLAVTALIRRWLEGKKPSTGARAAIAELDFDAFRREFIDRNISFSFRYSHDGRDSLLDGPMGNKVQNLPSVVRDVHHLSNKRLWTGVANIDVGKTPWAWMIRKLVGFPNAGNRVPIIFRREVLDDQEVWYRTFGRKTMITRFSTGQGRESRLIIERFGLLGVGTAMVERGGMLHVVPRTWNFLKLPMPNIFLPVASIVAAEKTGRYHFKLNVRVPWLGHVVTYSGHLVPA